MDDENRGQTHLVFRQRRVPRVDQGRVVPDLVVGWGFGVELHGQVIWRGLGGVVVVVVGGELVRFVGRKFTASCLEQAPIRRLVLRAKLSQLTFLGMGLYLLTHLSLSHLS